MAAEVGFRFDGEAASGRLVVPAVSVGEDREGRFVYVLENVRGGARRRAPHPRDHGGAHRRRASRCSADSSDGEHVVTAGVRRLTDGELVLVQEGA